MKGVLIHRDCEQFVFVVSVAVEKNRELSAKIHWNHISLALYISLINADIFFNPWSMVNSEGEIEQHTST